MCWPRHRASGDLLIASDEDPLLDRGPARTRATVARSRMASSGRPQAMVAAFETTDGDLGDRLLIALDAAQGVGGDFRGMQSARARGAYG